MESVAVVADQYTSLVKKGRRAKRQRSFAGAITSLSSTGGDGSDGTADGGGGSNFENNLYSSSSTASASGHCNSDDQDIMSEITTEEEDMAYCLIMLARGTTFTTATATATATASATTTGIDKLPAVATKYECKTCNKTFHSFQALGGHRASHKKPKLTSPENQSTSPNPNPNPNPYPSPSLSPSPILDHNQQVKTNEGPTNKMAALRVHECSICGSEFPSGQALGGHMRRHRTTPLAAVPVGRPIESGPRNVVLPLDLNLPAPGDDDDVKIEAADSLGQSSGTTTFHRVLPTPALVDCHY